MKVGFEAKRFFKNFTGLGNYSRFVVDALSTYYPKNEYLLFSPQLSNHPEVTPITGRANVSIVSPPSIYGTLKMTSLWRSLGMSYSKEIKSLNIFHGLSHELPWAMPANMKKVVTIHDLIFLRYPKFYNPADVFIYKTKVSSACKRADKIIAISEQTASDIVEYLGVDRRKIQIIYQGSHPSFKRKTTKEEREHVQAKYKLPKQYILNVGTIEERKNVLSLIKAYRNIPPTARVPLVIIGRPTPYIKLVKEYIEAHNLNQSVIFLHGISFTDFPALYQGASVFIYPSLFEGFGIPLIEAIESKVPVITSKGSCFSEAGGPYTKYVEASDDQEFSNMIQKVLEDETERNTMIENSYEYIQKFQPQVIASQVYKLYKSL